MRAAAIIWAAIALLLTACSSEPDFDSAYAEQRAAIEAEGAKIEEQVAGEMAAAREAEQARRELEQADGAE